ncbi:MAG: serpin family protein [Planctomycetes bacterium]|nr:serpin family protein [Planctomycetota bacterium]
MADFGSRLRRLFGGGGGASASSEEASDPATAPDPFAEGNDDFALALHGSLRQRPGNLFFSPFSVRAALAMAYAGARGETAREMREALRLRLPDEDLHPAFAQAVQRLRAAREVEIAIADSLWSQEGSPLETAFLERIGRHYGGGANPVDFRRRIEDARTTINRWVEAETRQRIRDLIPPGGLDSETRLVVANAVFFKGLWERQFPRKATREEAFRLEGGGTVRAPLMRQRAPVGYVQADGYQAVDLPYRGGELSMLVLLPDRVDGIRDLEGTISGRLVRNCAAKMSDREVDLLLPRFKVTWGTVDLRGSLAALGMALAFNRSKADLSGINGLKPPHEDALFFAAVFHKAFVDVNEEGTEAAAATAAVVTRGMAAPAPPVPVFRADHPFLFAIRDRRSGAILFLGRMADPSREN